MITALTTKWKEWKWQRRVERLYYKDPDFQQIDQALLKAYRFKNPYTLSRRFLEGRGERDVHVYGETPLETLALIAKEAGLTASDHVYDLGCGRGRGALFLASHIGCSVTGIEWIPSFVTVAQTVAAAYSSKAAFECKDMLKADLKEASIIYLAGTCFKDETILKLITRLKLCNSSKIITISYPLSDYSDGFTTIKEFPVSFPWGETTAFIQTVAVRNTTSGFEDAVTI